MGGRPTVAIIKLEVSCQILACFSVKPLNIFQEALVKLVQQSSDLDEKQSSFGTGRLQRGSAFLRFPAHSFVRRRMFGLAGPGLDMQHPVWSASARCTGVAGSEYLLHGALEMGL